MKYNVYSIETGEKIDEVEAENSAEAMDAAVEDHGLDVYVLPASLKVAE